ncbi:MAG TPA: BlaI/MecI/CopY family transcriptional regulator [Polyangiaceae bacterium]|nr:BlaI/MecI/CopY family transcriptional regulator [Polyangiaceae bacterium]
MAESLGVLESAVLEALSRASEPLSVREVQARLQPKSELAYTTVLTVLDRLHEKDLVRREKRGRAFYYRPHVTAEQWRGQRAAKILAGRDAPPTRAVLMAFLDGAERVGPGVLHELSLLLDERRRNRKNR